MKSQDLPQEEKLHVILCGPLSQTEAALLQRGDVEIRREKNNLNLLAGIQKERFGCDMIIVEAPYGHGLYSMTYPVGEHKTCPVWMVEDPPDEVIWKEINYQLDEVPEKRKKAHERAIAMGPPKNEILILADTPQMRSNLTDWMQEIYKVWNMPLPKLNVPADIKTYLRELRWPEAPPEAVVIALTGVDSLKAAERVRQLYPKTGLVWCCDLDFSSQAYRLEADYFFLMSEASTGKLGIGLDRVYQYNKRGNEA